jgi:hypothetical protein
MDKYPIRYSVYMQFYPTYILCNELVIIKLQ